MEDSTTAAIVIIIIILIIDLDTSSGVQMLFLEDNADERLNFENQKRAGGGRKTKSVCLSVSMQTATKTGDRCPNHGIVLDVLLSHMVSP